MQPQDVFYDAAADDSTTDDATADDAAAEDATADDAAADNASHEPLALLDLLLQVPQLLMACTSVTAIKQLRLICKPLYVAATAEMKSLVVDLGGPAFLDALSRLPVFLKGSGCHLRCFGVILPFTSCSKGNLSLGYSISHMLGSDVSFRLTHWKQMRNHPETQQSPT